MDKNNSLINSKPNKCLAWSITRACNYQCSYCVSSGRTKILSSNPDPYKFLGGFSKQLKDSWKFFICGSGEPFLAPRFLDIIKTLVAKGHKIVVVTNFSAPLKTLIQFCRIAGKNLHYIAASLHLDFVELDEFLEKSIKIRNIIGNKFNVRSVANEGEVFQLVKIGKKFKKNGIDFFIKTKRNYNGFTEVPVKYKVKEWEVIRDFSLHHTPYDYGKNNYQGKKCWAGCKYFVINEKADAWRCYPAEQSQHPEGYLGNLVNGTFNFKKGSSKCIYTRCFCTQPILNNMIVR